MFKNQLSKNMMGQYLNIKAKLIIAEQLIRVNQLSAQLSNILEFLSKRTKRNTKRLIKQ